MRRLILCLVLLLALPVWAQEVRVSPSPSARPESLADPAHEPIELLRQHMEDALNARNVDSLLEGVARNAVFTNLNGETVQGKENIGTYFNKMVMGPQARVKEIKVHLEFDGAPILYPQDDDSEQPEFCVVLGHSQDQYTLSDGSKLETEPRWSATLKKDEQSWKVVSFHYSTDMFANPILRRAQGRLLMAVLAGVLLGGLAGYLIGTGRRARLG